MVTSWEQKVAWGRKNYRRGYDSSWKIQKFLSLAANMTALAEALEEEEQMELVTPKQVQWWKSMYEALQTSD